MSNKKIHPNGNIELTLVLSWNQIAAEYQRAVNAAIANTKIAGFRKGKAPKELILPKLDKTKLYSQCIEKLLPPVYAQAVASHQLKPILPPAISLQSGAENRDWVFTAITCEAPPVELPANWLDEIRKLPPPHPHTDKLKPIIDWLQDRAKLTVPDILAETETNHRLSLLANNITQVGLSMDSYLKSRGINTESLRSQTKQSAIADLRLEFILQHLTVLRNLNSRQDTLEFLRNLL